MSADAPSRQYLTFDQFIEAQVEKARNGIRWAELLTAAVGLAVIVLAYLSAFVVLDHWVVPGGFSPLMRGALLGAAALTAAVWLGFKVVRPALRRINRLYAADQIERHDPTLRGGLMNLLDGPGAAGPEVRAAMQKRAAAALRETDVDDAVDRRALVRFSTALLALVVFACAYALFSPKAIGDSLVRALLPAADVAPVTRTRLLSVEPRDTNVLAGEMLTVTAVVGGEIPEEVFVTYTTDDGRAVGETVPLRLAGDEVTFEGTLAGPEGRGLTGPLTYTVLAGDAEAGPFRVSVSPAPHAELERVELAFPDYTGLEPITQSSPAVDAVEGTWATFTATAALPVERALVNFADDPAFDAPAEQAAMEISEDGKTLTGAWKLARRPDGSSPAFYRIEVTDAEGFRDPRPTVYPITVRPDEPPEVTLLDPEADIARPANATVPLKITARDPDFRLRYLALRREKNGEPVATAIPLWEDREPAASLTYDWDLSEERVEAGDVLTYWIEARDNREPMFNTRNTPRLTITITEPVPQDQAERQLEQDRERQAEQDRREAADENSDPADPDAEGDPQPEDDRQEPGADGEPGEDAQPGADGEARGDGQPGKDGEAGMNQQAPNGGEPQGDPAAGGQRDGDQGEESGGEQVAADGSEDDVALEKVMDRLSQNPDDAPPQPGEDGAGEAPESDPQGDEQQPGARQPGENGAREPSAESNDAGEQPSADQPAPEAGGHPDGGSDAAAPDNAAPDAGEEAGGMQPSGEAAGEAGEEGADGNVAAGADSDDSAPNEMGEGADPAGPPGESPESGDPTADGQSSAGQSPDGQSPAGAEPAGDPQQTAAPSADGGEKTGQREAGDPADAPEAAPGEGAAPNGADPNAADADAPDPAGPEPDADGMGFEANAPDQPGAADQPGGDPAEAPAERSDDQGNVGTGGDPSGDPEADQERSASGEQANGGAPRPEAGQQPGEQANDPPPAGQDRPEGDAPREQSETGGGADESEMRQGDPPAGQRAAARRRTGSRRRTGGRGRTGSRGRTGGRGGRRIGRRGAAGRRRRGAAGRGRWSAARQGRRTRGRPAAGQGR